MASVAPSGSVENGYGNFGQLGTGNNETLGDEVSVLWFALLGLLQLQSVRKIF